MKRVVLISPVTSMECGLYARKVYRSGNTEESYERRTKDIDRARVYATGCLSVLARAGNPMVTATKEIKGGRETFFPRARQLRACVSAVDASGTTKGHRESSRLYILRYS